MKQILNSQTLFSHLLTLLFHLKVPEFDLPSCFNIIGGLGPDATLMDMLEVADDQLAFESGLIGNSDIKADYGGKMRKYLNPSNDFKRSSSLLCKLILYSSLLNNTE